ncbi:hypothetical protein MRX96_027258 [Rhipicephalus microplus]
MIANPLQILAGGATICRHGSLPRRAPTHEAYSYQTWSESRPTEKGAANKRGKRASSRLVLASGKKIITFTAVMGRGGAAVRLHVDGWRWRGNNSVVRRSWRRSSTSRSPAAHRRRAAVGPPPSSSTQTTTTGREARDRRRRPKRDLCCAFVGACR